MLLDSLPLFCGFAPQDSSLITVPTIGVDQITKGSVKDVNAGWPGIKSTSTLGGQSVHGNGINKSCVDMQQFYSSQYDQYDQYGTQQFGGQFGQLGSQVLNSGFDSRHLVQDSAFLHTWQTNGRYLHQVMLFYS